MEKDGKEAKGTGKEAREAKDGKAKETGRKARATPTGKVAKGKERVKEAGDNCPKAKARAKEKAKVMAKERVRPLATGPLRTTSPMG